MRPVLLLLAVVICSFARTSLCAGEHNTKPVLSVVASGPYPDPLEQAWAQGIALVSAVRVAFNQINNNSKILPDYHVEVIDDDSGCRIPSKALQSFHKNTFYSGKRIVGIIGPACSGPTLLVAPLLARPEISVIQIAPSATSPTIQALNQSTTFTMNSPFGLANAFVDTVKSNNWTQLTVLHDGRRSLFKAFANEVSKQINQEPDINVVESTSILDLETDDNGNQLGDPVFPIDVLRAGRSRVVLLLLEPVTAQRFLCVAAQEGLVYPRYQWIMVAKSLSEFQNENGRTASISSFDFDGINYKCPSEVMSTALNGSIIAQFRLKRDNLSDVLSPDNITVARYRELVDAEYQELLKEDHIERIVQEALELRNENNEPVYMESQFGPSDDWENLYYDAAWSLALAMDAASRKGLDLSKYSYGQPELTSVLLKELQNVDFEGSVGPVRFTEDRYVRSPVVVSQWFKTSAENLSETKVALYVNDRLNFINGNNFEHIRDTFGERDVRIHISLGIIVVVVTIALTILTAGLQIAFIYWYKEKSVRATSPEISHLIFAGCYLFAMAAILFSLQQTLKFNTPALEMAYSVICNVITWCLLLGYSLIFGTVFVKVWRVFKLFRHFRNERPGVLLSDQSLVVVVICLVVVDCVICIVWNTIDPWLLEETIGDILDVPGSEPVVTKHLMCACEFDIYWIAVVAAYKGVIALLLVIFSILNRKIQRKHFSHTKKINILVYSLTVLGGIGFPMYFILASISYVQFLIFNTIFLTTMVMCCLMLFLPPLWPLLRWRSINREPSSTTLYRRGSITSLISSLRRGSTNSFRQVSNDSML